MMTRDQQVAVVRRPDLLASEAALVAERQITWAGRYAELGQYGTTGGSAADRRRIVEAMAQLEQGVR